MGNNQINPEQKDSRLWNIARKRAAFKRHLASYLIINAVLWAIWLFKFFSVHETDFRIDYHIPWPAYVTFFWGIGILFDFLNSYFFHQSDMVEREYQKLKNKSKL